MPKTLLGVALLGLVSSLAYAQPNDNGGHPASGPSVRSAGNGLNTGVAESRDSSTRMPDLGEPARRRSLPFRSRPGMAGGMDPERVRER